MTKYFEMTIHINGVQREQVSISRQKIQQKLRSIGRSKSYSFLESSHVDTLEITIKLIEGKNYE